MSDSAESSSKISTETEAPKIKKGTRGRPKKSGNLLTKSGIKDTPIDDQHIVELVSNYLIPFKKLSEIIKELGQEKLYLKFVKDGMYICSRDNKKLTYNKFFICGETSAHYYFSEDVCDTWNKTSKDYLFIPLIRNSLEQIFKNVENDTIDIKLNINKNIKEFNIANQYKNRLSINPLLLPNMPPEPIEGSDLDLAFRYNYDQYLDYQLSFDLPFKTLKTTLERAVNRDIFIIKEPGKQLIIKCNNQSSDFIPFVDIYNNPSEIELVNNLKENQSLQVILKPDKIPIATDSCISFMKFVKISITEGRPISLKWYDVDDNGRMLYYYHLYI